MRRFLHRNMRPGTGALLLVLALAALSTGVAIAASGSAGDRGLSAAPANTSAPKLNGTLTEGAKLTATPGTWTSNSPPLSFAYQWFRCNSAGGSCAAIAGATQQAYTLEAADVSNRVLVQVTAIDSAGMASSAVANSAASGAIKDAGDPAVAPDNVVRPTVRGRRVQGATLAAFVGMWNGIRVPIFTYLWSRCGPTGHGCNPIPLATSSTYRLVAADVARTLRVQVTATNSTGTESVNSPATSIVTIPLGPSNTQVPTITGTSETGQQLQASNGQWSGATPITFTYQWQRCGGQGQDCQPIQGATQQIYSPQSTYIWSTLVVVVTATNSNGHTAATSTATSVVTSGIPAGGTIPVSQIALPNQLLISVVDFAPNVLHSRASFTARFRITDAQGRQVSGAHVLVLTIPFGRVEAGGVQVSDENGWATFTLRPTLRLPIKQSSLIAVYARATKPGEPTLGGVSARRLSSVRISPA